MTRYCNLTSTPPNRSPLQFVDLFAGCGGLSLGLSLAGLRGLFAIERDPMAFKTLSTNLLLDRGQPIQPFLWPEWLEKQAWPIDDLLKEHMPELTELKGTVDVLAGAPPCQGFSFAGRRQESDPRNQLFEKYVDVVTAIRPSALILENVPGMMVGHVTKEMKAIAPQLKDTKISLKSPSYYERLVERLDKVGYSAHGQIVDSSRFGVPQKRPRLIVIGIKKELAQYLPGGDAKHAFELLEKAREAQLRELGLSDEAVTVKDAISDLETKGKKLIPHTDKDSPSGFHEAEYSGPKTDFQRLMHSNCPHGQMNSMRLARHRSEVRERFERIIAECPKGLVVNAENREKYGIKKHRIIPMLEGAPAPTITTLPDDILHYSEPRILTVRESARLQSFPDWFHFRGKFTTGGNLRTKECPRYTQVGNAVPPHLARAIGIAIRETLNLAEELASQQADCASPNRQMANII